MTHTRVMLHALLAIMPLAIGGGGCNGQQSRWGHLYDVDLEHGMSAKQLRSQLGSPDHIYMIDEPREAGYYMSYGYGGFEVWEPYYYSSSGAAQYHYTTEYRLLLRFDMDCNLISWDRTEPPK